MKTTKSDQLRLRHWSVMAVIGAYAEEQQAPQELRLDLKLRGDFSRAAATDDLAAAMDYAEFRKRVEAWIAGRRWQLLERFAEELCDFIFTDPQIKVLKMTVEKPAAQAPVGVSYTITRVNKAH